MVTTLVAVAMVVGLVGTVVPLVPGLSLITAAAVAYGMIEGFGRTGVAAMIVIGALALAGTVAGFVLPGRAAGGAGASRTSLLVGLASGVIGFFVVPIVGIAIGATIGIYLGERVRSGDHAQAWQATLATLKGFGAGAIAQLAAALMMVLTWTVWVLVE